MSSPDHVADASRGLTSAEDDLSSDVARASSGTDASLFLVPLLVIFGLTVLIALKGVAVGGDGRAYIAMAEDLRGGYGFRAVAGFDAAHFPPGLSLVLVGLSFLGVSSTAAALIVNLGAWVATLFAVDQLYRFAGGRNDGWRRGLLLAVACSGAIALPHADVLSEPLYLAVSLWLLVVVSRWNRSPSFGNGLLVWTLAASVLAVRYVGICLIIATAMAAFGRGRDLGRSARGALLPISAVLPMAVWYLATRTGSRADAPSVSGVDVSLSNIPHSLAALGAIFAGGLPYSRKDTILVSGVDPMVRGGLAVLGVVTVSALLYRLLAWWRGRANRTTPHRDDAVAQVSRLVVLYSAIYASFMILWRIPAGYYILTRYWVPIVLPVFAIILARCSVLDLSPRAAALLPRLAGVAIALNLSVSIVWILH